MSDWTSKYAIMRDLAVAQGFDVPADLEGIGANEKPPALNIPEDTGEDYFGHGVGEGDCAGPPDLVLIQHMLDMVRDVGISNGEDFPEQVVHISKPNSLNIGVDITKTGTIPKTFPNKHVTPQAKKVKKKRENVAVNSILLAMAGDSPIANMEIPREPLKLLKPNDFISEEIETEIVQSVEKVNGWLDTQVPSTSGSRFAGNPLLLDPGSMFKRKDPLGSVKSPGSDSYKSSSPEKPSTSNTGSSKPSVLSRDTQEASSSKTKTSSYPLALEAGSMFKRKSGSTAKSIDSDSVNTSPHQQQVGTIGSYRPSVLAGEYYQKYVERSKMKEIVNEDVWSRAERKMKEIDERKKLEAEAAAREAALLASTTDVSNKAVDADLVDIDKVAINEILIDSTTINEARDVAAEAKVPATLVFLQNGQSSPSQDSSFSGRDLIELPQHRHLLTGECIVCKVVKDHGYDVEAEIYGNPK